LYFKVPLTRETDTKKLSIIANLQLLIDKNLQILENTHLALINLEKNGVLVSGERKFERFERKFKLGDLNGVV
jgi:hypothetical protein